MLLVFIKAKGLTDDVGNALITVRRPTGVIEQQRRWQPQGEEPEGGGERQAKSLSIRLDHMRHSWLMDLGTC